MTQLIVLAVITDAIFVILLATHASPDRRNFIDEHQGDGSIRDEWALEGFDATVRAATTRLR